MTMSNGVGQFGDTTLTKVFVGGLAWETPKEALREHFEKYGEILEAVIISDKITGRSKGYGFVTFKEAGAANKACEDAAPIINGRRANCNLASLGARRPRSSTPAPPQQGPNIIAGPRSTPAPPANHVQWYYPAGSAAASPFHHQHHQAVPFYGYSPAYIATDISYNHYCCDGWSTEAKLHRRVLHEWAFLSGVSRASYGGCQYIDANVPSLSLPSITGGGPTCCPHLPTKHGGSHDNGPNYHVQTPIHCSS
ncbi:probable RNA-binding protein ARP1 isoform X3 [Populus trichocarpa]|uniref:probable RNA-binding protein ARP1 isoform X3 n=1 Tax=Populus trichocarpa TaxID=3694 RepID=UPI000D189515|nr:probable RNA-binding protein ARP1 isoform X3 [Populus trichocarpa]XP_024462448.1 probable RNA-binding protein ARP1 isoform X3 [Populus trichocarpa]|eukprot:XP_024462447.1 probable RNA-binding protein ARP1 isoform X3 [Populus trichocarpa]